MKQKIPMSETQAAKVLEADVTKSSISISDHSAVLSAIDDDGKSSNGDQRGSGPGSAKPQADQDPVIGSKPEKGTSKQSSRTKSGPSIDESSWLHKIIQWVIIARNASGYFENARKKGHESSNRGGSGTGPEWRLWSSVKDWWFGSAAA
ncbi:hypothetical protein IL306_006783 [Fusarium sp. DS 682]|nr:hypothetical protein IL306_006783 [Fusarium sp. DS 682]